ncbi:hypothetical protein M409DRAFT_59083 [Zasmidium cellare ATCC 36951]|uniref:SMAD/FHA domain-containing protein n=1 Tax=Zasmidium cellare ATCC 36951 TaxID=1080233 RepID=A0A6A6C2L5_ZASCE|nr:uncharacterized protein M409DRAFT_59083 [Zasmidium cellare ATCC 36951]KAF2161367.1 hypothetical protein M409DRAFT_59083 [Zasmidium cellare ATCC 36951]
MINEADLRRPNEGGVLKGSSRRAAQSASLTHLQSHPSPSSPLTSFLAGLVGSFGGVGVIFLVHSCRSSPVPHEGLTVNTLATVDLFVVCITARLSTVLRCAAIRCTCPARTSWVVYAPFPPDMLNSAQPTPSSLYAAATTSTTPTSPSRPSRLRGLSYLRSYTHNHLHSSRSDPPTLTRSTSSPGVASPTTAATPTPIAQQPPQQPVPERGSQSAIQSVEGGWIPRSGLIRESAQPTTTSTPASPEPVSSSTMMTRSRTASSLLGPTPTAVHPAQRRQPAFDNTPTTDPFTMLAPSAPANTAAGPSKDQLPTIRFIPHVETRSSRPSLQFTALSRTLKNTTAVVRVGRYSERDNHTGDPNTLPVGFKSKVVSRRHCEFWCTEGQWYIKDVKSSSGTFLNHVRLSSPGVESRPYPVNDGDVVQLGIDFKGGEELIFRCVKIRVECNRGWQKSLNSFNTAAHKRLFKSALKTKNRDSDAMSVNSSECSICLNPVAPCQALFVAPCSHVWHYKCVRNLIHGPQWPNFVCPNCRFVADLDADVEQPEDEDYMYDEEMQHSTEQVNGGVEAGGSDEQSPNWQCLER